MGKYILTAPNGEEFEIESDNPPTEEMANEVFSAANINKQASPLEKGANRALGATTLFDRGLTYGFGRKLGGLMYGLGAAGLVDSFRKDKTFKQSFRKRYNEIVDPAVSAAAEFGKENPKTAFALELSGSLLNPVNKAGGKYIVQGKGLKSIVGRSGAIGAGTGLLTGAGRSESADEYVGNIPLDVTSGAVLGTLLPLGSEAFRQTKKLFPLTLGMTSGAGSQAIRQAYDAGKRGSKTFKDNLRGNVDMSEVVDDAKAALRDLKVAKNTQYAQNMDALKLDKTKLDIKPIVDELRGIENSYKVGGFSKAGKDTRKALSEIRSIVKDFAKDQNIHTAEGFDALKQRIQDIAFPYESREANRVVSNMAREVKNSISKQAPVYAKTMKSYTDSSDLIHELERSLSLQSPKPKDMALRKLQSVFRNNVTSNYGNRQSLLNSLEKGENKISDALAGQSLSSWNPRGLLSGSLGGLAGVASLSINPYSIVSAPVFSPRAVGEASYLAGKGANLVNQYLPDRPLSPYLIQLINSTNNY